MGVPRLHLAARLHVGFCCVLESWNPLKTYLQWGLLAFLTLPLSIWAVCLKSSIASIDQDRAYQFYLLISFLERSTEIFSGSMCAYFLIMTFVGKAKMQTI
mmetsp:Transcript_14003/g.21371  ORF Transcript_14003/g.21371 Transcript_14003/m.21371 type:complete len:101 (+) Transcript_14003:2-304(+)